MIQQTQLDFLRYQVTQLRKLDFMASHATPGLEEEEQYDQIWQEMKADALQITQMLYPDANIQDGLLTIDGKLMCSLSEYWWQLIDAALADL